MCIRDRFKRLQNMLCCAERRFDHVWTSGMTSAMVCMLLWAVSRIRPDSVSNMLGVKTYKEVWKQCSNAGKRTRCIMGDQQYDLMIIELLRAGVAGIAEIVERFGFQRDWLGSTEPRKKKPKETKEPVPTGLTELQHQMQMALARMGPNAAVATSAVQQPPSRELLAALQCLMPSTKRVAQDFAPTRGIGSGNVPALAATQGIGSAPALAPPHGSGTAPALAPSQGSAGVPTLAPAQDSGGVLGLTPAQCGSGGLQSNVGQLGDPALASAQGGGGGFTENSEAGAVVEAPAQGSGSGPADVSDADALSELPTVTPEEAGAVVEAPAQGNGSGSADVSAANGLSEPSTLTPEVSAQVLPAVMSATAQPTAQDGGLTPDQLSQIAVNRAKARAKRKAIANGVQEGDAGIEEGVLPKCVICQCPMKVEEERYALPCMHAFHSDCIHQYAECKGLPVLKCCPFKCGVGPDDLCAIDDQEEGHGDASASSSLLADAMRALDEAARLQ